MDLDTLLMVDLVESEEMLVKRLIRSFDIKAESVKKISFKNNSAFFNEKDICLVIIRIDQNTTKNIENIRWIKRLLPVPVPLLILLPLQMASSIYTYIKAGADDYIVTPLDDESFAMRFYVLLECGQAILATKNIKQKELEKDKFQSNKDTDTWRVIVGYLQEGLSFFTPKYQLARRGRHNIFNKWKPIRKIATGGDGIVWLVQEVGKEREAVAKIPNSKDMNVNSLRAAAVLKRLFCHPNIVQLIEVVKEDEKFILIQEYVHGVTLWERLARNASSQDKEKMFVQLLSVIAHIHNHKIIHRDIKPDNIMIQTDGTLKLLDFGSAKEINWRDRGNSPEGTLNFMPPEQFEGKTCIASDVWALGVILYLFALNRLPFYQDNSYYPMDITTDMSAVLPRKIRADIPIGLEQVIMRCLDTNLDSRYKNASMVKDDLMQKLPDFGNGLYIPAVS